MMGKLEVYLGSWPRCCVCDYFAEAIEVRMEKAVELVVESRGALEREEGSCRSTVGGSLVGGCDL